MPSAFTCDINMELSIPDFSDATLPLKQIAEKVATESQKNIRNQTNLNGSTYTRLSKKTIQDKIREKVSDPTKALYRKGVMFRAIHVYSTGKNSYEVGVKAIGKPRRDLVGMIHQEIGPVIRTFLGISDSTRAWCEARIDRWIAEKRQKAAKKVINLKY